MHARRIGVMLCALQALTACGSDDDNNDAPPDPPATDTRVYEVSAGSAIVADPGWTAGYLIGAMSPDHYRVRFTGSALSDPNAASIHFTGSLFTTGAFTEIVPSCGNAGCPLEAQDSVSNAISVEGYGQRIDLDLTVSTGYDGFDVATDGAPIYFEVFADGEQDPAMAVFVLDGDDVVSSPTSVPFGIDS